MEALERFQRVADLILTDYLKALMLLTEGARTTLTVMGMSPEDVVTNLSSVMGKAQKQIDAQRKKVGHGT
jgi:hypothetical protein